MPRLIDADALMDYCNNQKDKTIDANDIARFPTVGGWVSVKDRLPGEETNPLTMDFKEVLCFCDFGGIPRRTDVRTYKFGKRSWMEEGHFWHGGTPMDAVVTHWMPLPEPPEEKIDEC